MKQDLGDAGLEFADEFEDALFFLGRFPRGHGGVQVVEDPVAADLRQSKGTFGWAGAYGTNINVDPQEKMVTIIMMQTSTPQLQRDFENAVMQAIID